MSRNRERWAWTKCFIYNHFFPMADENVTVVFNCSDKNQLRCENRAPFYHRTDWRRTDTFTDNQKTPTTTKQYASTHMICELAYFQVICEKRCEERICQNSMRRHLCFSLLFTQKTKNQRCRRMDFWLLRLSRISPHLTLNSIVSNAKLLAYETEICSSITQ